MGVIRQFLVLLNKEKSYVNIDPGTLFISLLKKIFVPTKLHWKLILWLLSKCPELVSGTYICRPESIHLLSAGRKNFLR